MIIYERDLDEGYNLKELHDAWIDWKEMDPWNHAEDFSVELLEILMATVNDRNDCDIIGLTPRETDRFITTLRAKLDKEGRI